MLDRRRTARYASGIGAILITASIWALLHPGSPARWLGLFLVGLLYALTRLRTGSIYLPMLVHGIGNAVAVFSIAHG